MHNHRRSNDNDLSAFQLISLIFLSDMSIRLKMDCVCRVLAQRYGFEAVSILLYDGPSDSLINRGTFIDELCLHYIGTSDEMKYRSRHLLKYISFYDFLYDRFYYTGIPALLTAQDIDKLIEAFKRNTFFSYKFDLKILTPEFVKECYNNSVFLATNNISLKGSYYRLLEDSFYNSYKRKYKSSEQYTIGPEANNYSGRIFWASSIRLTQKINGNYPFYFADTFYNKDGTPFVMSKKNMYFFYNLKNFCNYKIEGAYRYCGIPLMSNERCLGVLRILTKAGNNDTFHDPERMKSLRHAAEILSNFLDQCYPQEFNDRIDHDWDEEQLFEAGKEKNKPDALCNSLLKAMDSFGAVIYLSAFPGDKPTIAGRSTDSPYFAPLAQDVLQKQKLNGIIIKDRFNPILPKLFHFTASRDKMLVDDIYRLVGISIMVNCDDKKLSAVKYYYCHKNNHLSKGSERIRETSDPFIFRNKKHPALKSLVPPSMLSAFKKIPVTNLNNESFHIKVQHVLILDIPALQVDGIMAFFNTANRSFNLPDVRFAYSEMKRLGLEISKVNNERIKNYKQISTSYFHDIKNLLKISMAEKVIDTGFEIDLLKYIYSKVINFQRLAAHNSKLKISRHQEATWNFVNAFESHCARLSHIGDFYKKTRVWFNSNDIKTRNTLLNREIFELCFFILLENALKYSYGSDSKRKIENFNEQDEKTPGHVHVNLLEDDTHHILSVKNWGCEIFDCERIFDQTETPDTVRHFLNNENKLMHYEGGVISLWRASHRIGLYALSKFIRDLDGECECKSINGETEFILKIRKYERKNKQRSNQGLVS